MSFEFPTHDSNSELKTSLLQKHPNGSVALIDQKDLAIRTKRKTQIGSSSRGFALSGVLILDHLQVSLADAFVVKQNASDRVLASARQVICVDVEDFAARVVSEQQQIG